MVPMVKFFYARPGSGVGSLQAAGLAVMVFGCAGEVTLGGDAGTVDMATVEASSPGDDVALTESGSGDGPAGDSSTSKADQGGKPHKDQNTPKPDAKPWPKPDSKPWPKPDSKPWPKPDSKPWPKPDAQPPKPLPYPKRTAYRIKGIQPDHWPNKKNISGNQAGGVAMNLVWAGWEPKVTKAPCAKGQEAYEGHCFTISKTVDAEIRDYTKLGLVVTAVVYGVPAWARKSKGCSPVSAGFEIFCAPKNAADYGRFAGYLAQRYDGHHGHGRVADFVIHNEVNHNNWFDVYCGQGVACSTKTWLDTYAASYIAAYDRIVKHQPEARVLVSLDHSFGAAYDKPAAKNPSLSGMTVIKGLASRVGKRKWRVAFHPYPPNLLSPAFSPDDLPRVTYGNIGVLAGWLRKTYPSRPSAWEIHLTESGVNSLSPQSSPTKQADGVCRSFHNVLGTPGIVSYIYHRMKDHPVEVKQGLGLGLHTDKGTPKPAWVTWALANRADLKPPKLSCGFQYLPYTLLVRSYNAKRGHWASTRHAPSGFKKEHSWKLLRGSKAGTKLLYECQVGQHNLISPSVACENLQPLGPVGYIYTAKQKNTVPLFRCRIGGGKDHFISSSATCEGQVKEMLLGYALK